MPDAGVLFDYNRFAYARLNPLKYTDPTGHYTNDEIMQHFGCSDWACVEGFFQDGGSYAGLWGWLHMLQMSEDGWSVESSQVVGDNLTLTIYGQFQRDASGKINVHAQGFRNSAGLAYQFSALAPESMFAQYPQGAAIGYYFVRSSTSGGYATSKEAKREYLHLDPKMLVVSAMKAGAGFGPAIVQFAPATGPAAPLVAEVGAAYTAIGWTTVAIADFVIPSLSGDKVTPAVSATTNTGSFLIDSYGGTAGKYTSPFIGPAVDVVTGACYGTGCPR